MDSKFEFNKVKPDLTEVEAMGVLSRKTRKNFIHNNKQMFSNPHANRYVRDDKITSVTGNRDILQFINEMKLV